MCTFFIYDLNCYSVGAQNALLVFGAQNALFLLGAQNSLLVLGAQTALISKTEDLIMFDLKRKVPKRLSHNVGEEKVVHLT